MNIPFVDLKIQYQSLKPEIDAALAHVIESAHFIKGEAVNQFEVGFAAATGAKHCIGVANGTDALFIALKALGIGPGDEVITVANSFIATSEAISLSGARPVFVDCERESQNLNLSLLEERCEQAIGAGRKLKAIIPVHLYGRAVNMPEVMRIARRFELKVIEDCAQAHLARFGAQSAGTFGDLATFSFFPGKNLGAYGDAGAIVTGSDRLAAHCRMFANHGRVAKYDHDFEGINSRMDTLQAAVLNVKLPHLQSWTQKRIANAQLYRQLLADCPDVTLPAPAADGQHVYHLFVIRTPNRESLQRALQEAGISAAVHYPIALPNLKAYRWLEHSPADFPAASQLQDEILSLPMYAELSIEQIEWVAHNVRKAVTKG